MKMTAREFVAKVLTWINASPKIKIVTQYFQFYGGGQYQNWAIPVYSGYKCVGVVGYRAAGTTGATTEMFDIYIYDSGSEQRIGIDNTQAYGSGLGVTVDLLYVHETLLGG